MEFENGHGPEIQNEGTLEVSESLSVDHWQYGDGTPSLDQSADLALITKLLDQSWNCHGVVFQKILLWGPPGCGFVLSC
jgi:hypothetical protein